MIGRIRMANYLLAYQGGSMPEGEAEQQKVLTDWMNWFGALGSSIVDAGNPVGASASVSSAGDVSDGGHSALTGYSIISAGSLGEATDQAKGCPVLSSGGSVDVYEIMPVG
jgi:hypothetical protein